MDTSTVTGMFLSWQFIVMSLGIYAIIQATRTPVESKYPSLKTSEWWRGLTLITAPVGIGILFGIFAKKFPMTDQVAWEASRTFRCMFGAFAGLVSGWAYSLVKTLYRKATGASDPDAPSAGGDPSGKP
jgi:hypothetical protein